jgi:hypothetical protein
MAKRGFLQDPIPLPDGSDRSVACTFDCVDAILKYTDRCAPEVALITGNRGVIIETVIVCCLRLELLIMKDCQSQ